MYSKTINRKWGRNSIDSNLGLLVLFDELNAIIRKNEVSLKYKHSQNGCFIISTMTSF